MSIFQGIKRIFGFGDELDGYDTDETAAEVDVSVGNPQLTAECTQARETSDPVARPSIDPEMKQRIFKGVVEVFNHSLPDFLARSVDPEAQQKLLFDSLDESLKEYLNGLLLTAEQYAESKLKEASETSRREAERLRTEMHQLEQQRTAIREQQLSADRRRRALADRVSDLEAKLEAADAEREQLQLENKSMLNKLKVADIQPTVVEDMSRRIEELQAQLAAAATSPEAEDTHTSEEIQKLKETLDAAHIELAGTKEKLESALKELASTKEQLEDAHTELATAKDRLTETESLKQRIADNQEQAELVQNMYNDLQAKYADERESRERLEKDLAEANTLLEQVNEMQEQFNKVEAVIRKRDERIEKLKASNKRLREELDIVRRQLTAGDEANLFAYIETEATAKSEAPKDLPPLEDDFEVPEWFVSEPGPDAPSLHTTPSEPFGYSQPPKKPRKPDSEAQMTLF